MCGTFPRCDPWVVIFNPSNLNANFALDFYVRSNDSVRSDKKMKILGRNTDFINYKREVPLFLLLIFRQSGQR